MPYAPVSQVSIAVKKNNFSRKIALLPCQIKDNVLKADITIYDILWWTFDASASHGRIILWPEK